MTDELSKLFESTKRLYRTEADEAINRLLLILNSSLLNDRIISSIDPVLKRLMEVSNDIESIEDKNFKGIHELERKIRVEEKTLELLENSISTFISHRSLSTTLSILFESLYYEITKEEPTVIGELSEQEQTETNYANDKIQEKDWNTALPAITQKYYEQYSLSRYVANKEEFEKIVRAVIIQESRGFEDAIGCDGEVGLMQLMPGTAKQLGLNVPDYGTEDISNIEPCADEKRTSVSKCNIIHKENCKAEDERFDPIKNVDAGTRYLAERIAEFQNQWLGIAAYNAGSGGVKRNCQPLSINNCPKTFAGRIYVEQVKARMDLL